MGCLPIPNYKTFELLSGYKSIVSKTSVRNSPPKHVEIINKRLAFAEAQEGEDYQILDWMKM